jgi:thiamine-phosphate pyrophosphorylase
MDPRTGRAGGAKVPLSSPIPRLFWVTNDEVVAGADFIEHARAVMTAAGSACAIQLRAHGLSGRRFCELAARLRELTGETGAGFWINDRVDVALALRADGAQLGRRSLPVDAARRLLGRGCRIGWSAHDPSEVEARLADGADVVVLGNIYATASHPERAPLGSEAVRRACSSGRPIVAIGGISPERVREVIAAGAWGVAVLSGVWWVTDPAAAANRYVRILGESLGGTTER